MFYVVDKHHLANTREYDSGFCVAAYMWARDPLKFVVLKCDEKGDRIITLNSRDLLIIEQICNGA